MIDRAFTISGSGTVVTGTLIDGSLSVGQEVEVLPAELKARLRGLQTHKARIDVAKPGSRVAANLTGVATSQLERGYVLTSPGWLVPTARVDVKLRMLSDLKHPLRHSAAVSFFTGAAEVIAKVHLLEKEKLDAGDISWAQFALAEPVALVKGDHFIIRSPMDTLGGGLIVDSHAPRHRRFRMAIVQSLKIRGEGVVEDIIVATLEANQPLELEKLAVHCDLATDEAHGVVGELIKKGRVVAVVHGGQSLLFTNSGWGRLVKKAESVVENYHRKFPARSGMSKGELSSKLGLLPNSPALRKLFDDGVIVEEGTAVHLPSYRVQISQQQQAKIDAFLSALNQNPYSPPGDIILEPDLLSLLIEQRQVVKVSDGVFFSAAAYSEMVDKVISYAKSKGKVTLAEVRDMLGTSRKYAQALLEYMDEKKLTRRVGDERVLR
jgi:selenocysteine-specific elongation factor